MNKSTISLLVALVCLLLLNACAKKPVAPLAEISPAPPVVQTEAGVSASEGLKSEALSEAAAPAALLKLEKVYFDFDAYTLTPQAREVLAVNAEWLRKNPEARLTIEGHCDERGSDEYNLALGQRRADAAKNYLVGLGIAAARLTSISYGEERPAVTGSNESAWSQNRRAEFK
jgi:peptidoglycan-associated lipoprotein